MTKQVIKKLMIFLFINLLLAIFIIISNLKDKSPTVTESKATTPTVPSQNTVTANPNNIPATTPTVPVQNTVTTTNDPISNPIAPTIQESTNMSNVAVNSQVCVKVGPLNTEEKNTLEFILNKNKENYLASTEKKTTYQIYWDLGDNKDVAEELFKKQKDGAMSDQKFVLEKHKNKWVVNITKIEGEKNIAEKLTKELGAKADKLNAGGEWKFETSQDQHYYLFKDFQKLLPNTINSIEIILKPKKEPC